jgi:two-component system NtrC family sensor kinase
VKRTFSPFLSALWPRFWNRRAEANHYQTFSDYRRIWVLTVLLLASAALVPLSVMTLIDYELNRRAGRLETVLRTVRLTSNLRRSVTHFLGERLAALRFTVREESHARLRDPRHLRAVLKNLKLGFGGFIDLGVIDARGNQEAYVGPYKLTGKNYSQQDWFLGCRRDGSYVSQVFLGYRDVPHLVIAVKSNLPGGSFYILRATLDTARLIQILSSFEQRYSNAFLLNRAGIVQTPAPRYGRLFQKVGLPVPAFSARTRSFEAVDRRGNSILVGYAFIDKSPYLLFLVKRQAEIMQTWINLRLDLIIFFGLSLVTILIIILLTATFMINKVYEADRVKAETMGQMEVTSRLASIGRLAAGVAHEINNPLAVINEEVGLVKDLFLIEKKYECDEQLMEHIDSILDSVERCAVITKQLLGFARHLEVKIVPINLERVIWEVLGFLKKEAEYRNIELEVQVPADMPNIRSDRGKLQQILLNLVNNAFQAMRQGGRLTVRAVRAEPGQVKISVSDNGCGIPEKDLKRIFEPFFTTRGIYEGTGLGLSITYGLVRKLKGTIAVSSVVGEGTTFTVMLPLEIQEVGENEGHSG